MGTLLRDYKRLNGLARPELRKLTRAQRTLIRKRLEAAVRQSVKRPKITLAHAIEAGKLIPFPLVPMLDRSIANKHS